MGLKSEKLRPFWLTLSREEKKRFDQVKGNTDIKISIFNVVMTISNNTSFIQITLE